MFYFRYDMTSTNDCNTGAHTRTQTRRNGLVFRYRRNLVDLPKIEETPLRANDKVQKTFNLSN